MTEQSNRPTRVEGTAPDPLSVAARALEGAQPSRESWFTRPDTSHTPAQSRPRYTPYTPDPRDTSRDAQAQGVDGLPQRTPGASRAPRPEASFFDPPRPTRLHPAHQRPVAPHAQFPQQAYRPNPYTVPHSMQQPHIHSARPTMYANPAMPPYAAAQVPTRNGSITEHRPEPAGRVRIKRAALMPLAAMAVASAAISTLAQADMDSGTGFEDQAHQFTAGSDQLEATASIAAIERIGENEVVDAPEVIWPEEAVALQRPTARGRHSNGNYDAPSNASAYGGAHGGAHAVGETFSAPNSAQESTDPTPAPTPEPAPASQPEPEPTPAPEPAPEPAPGPEHDEPKQPTLSKNVIGPALDTVASVVNGLTGIELGHTR